MMINKFAIIFTLLFSLQLSANDAFDDIIEEIIPTSKLTSQQLKHLRSELAIQKAFIEGVKKIEIRGGKFVNIEQSTSTLNDLLNNSMNAKAATVGPEVREKLAKISKDGLNKKTLKNILLETKKYAYGFANNKKVFINSLMRRFGFDIGLVYFGLMQVDLTFPMIMMAQGQTQYGVLLATPISSIGTGTYAAIKSAVKYRQVVKRLGGWKIAKEHFNVFKKMKSFFHQKIFRSYDLFNMHLNSKNYVFTTQKRNLLNRFLQKMGWNKSLNYENLLRYMEDEGILPKVVDNVKRSNRVSEAKMIRLLTKVQQTNDPNILFKLKSKFGKYITELENLPDFSKQRKWVIKAMNAKSFDHFLRVLGSMPNEIPPSILDSLWRNKILIGITKSIDGYTSKTQYQAFRKLFEGYDKSVRAELTKSIETSMPSSLKSKFVDYVYESLGHVGACQSLFRRKSDNFIPFL